MKKFEYQTVSAEGHRFFGSGNNFSELKYYRIRLFLFSLFVAFAFCASVGAVEIVNYGIPGASSQVLLKRELPKALQQNPELAIVFIGTNDMINSKILTPPETYEKNIRLTINELQKAKCEIILVTVPPCNEELLFQRHKQEAYGELMPNSRIDHANEIIKKLAAEYKLSLVDFASVFKEHGTSGKDSLIRNPANRGGKDGVHPNAAGYRKLAEMIKSEIDRLKLRCERVACLGDSITYGVGVTGHGTATGDTYPGVLKQLLSQ